MSLRKRNRKLYFAWVIISVIAVLSMIAFTLVPLLSAGKL